jgi:ferrous iron transport protein A
VVSAFLNFALPAQLKLKSIFNRSIVLFGVGLNRIRRGLYLEPVINGEHLMSLAYAALNQGDELPKHAEGLAPAAVSLDSLSMGTPARVLAVRGEGAVARRLMEMGVVPGAPVRVIKAAPLGDPLEVRVRNYHLALRRSEARTISVVASDK